MLMRIAISSLWNRRMAAGLSLFTIAISVALLLGVERIRAQTRSSFGSTISGTDLIIGARTGSVPLLLYSVFRIGDASNNISYRFYQDLSAQPQIAWSIPISLGDAHRGFRVLGTTNAYFEHFRYGDKLPLAFVAGVKLNGNYDAVIGAEVAKSLNYQLGDAITVAHGTGRHDIATHNEQPFHVVGVLRRTGTPVDRTIHVGLTGIDAIHANFQSGGRASLPAGTAGEGAMPSTLTAIFVGLKNRAAALGLARQINEYPGEPLSAILPGLALAQLWSIVGIAESALLLIAICVVVAGLLGMITGLVTTLSERRREMAILRSVGAQPWQVGALLVFESSLLTLLGALLGLLLLSVVFASLAPWLANAYGLYLKAFALSPSEFPLLFGVLASGVLAGLMPALLAYRRTLADGLTIRT